jgi:hypothetical protein
MPLYFFSVSTDDAKEGFSLRDETEARSHAKRLADSLGAKLPESVLPLMLTITDEGGEKLFEQEISR